MIARPRLVASRFVPGTDIRQGSDRSTKVGGVKVCFLVLT